MKHFSIFLSFPNVYFDQFSHKNFFRQHFRQVCNTSTHQHCSVLVYYHFGVMENFLIMVEQPAPSQEVEIDGERLQFFNTKLKIWDYAKISSSDYQKLSFENKSSILKSYYVDMSAKYSFGTGIIITFYLFWPFFESFGVLKCISFKNEKIFFEYFF